MTRRFPFILICLAVLAIALSASVSSGGTPMDRGSAWLVQAQNADGSWGRRLDLQATAFSILALEATGRDCAADRALLRRLDCDSPYEIALQLLAARDSAMADRLLACQDPDGGWGDPYTTALGLIGLARVGRANPAATAWLLDRLNQDGSFGLQGTNEATAVVTYALLLAGQAGDMTGLSLAWLRGHQAPQGGWTHPTATAWAILALREAGGNGEEIGRAAAWLRETQLPDGAWGWGKEPRGALYPTALAVLALAALDPADPAAAAGAEYLLAGRGKEGGWYDEGLAAGTTMRAAEILSALGRTEGLGAAAAWLAKLEARHQEARAARFSFLLRFGSISPEDRNGTLAALLATENPTGGWGCEVGYESDLLTTSEVLRALWNAGHADPGVYRRSLDFLRSRQRADGGFNLGPGESGQVYVTAHLLLTLARLRPLVAVDGVVEPAMAWLLAQRQPDGSWGRGALDTAIAFAAAADRLSGAEAELTRRCLELAQEPDGSWGGDDLATALALAALDMFRANLRVTVADIFFAPDPAYLRDEVGVTVTVVNAGLAAAENVVVRLYRGVGEAAVQLGAETMAMVPAGTLGQVRFIYRPEVLGANPLSVIVDPENTVRESDEDDNHASRNLEVIPRTDLVVDPADIWVIPDDPGPADELTLKAAIGNLGGVDAGPFAVAFYDGDPIAGGTVLAKVVCPGVPKQGKAEVVCAATLAEGGHHLFVVADVDEAVREDDEGNNTAAKDIAVVPRIDLAISAGGIAFTPDDPLEDDLVTIIATVVNKRECPATGVRVGFYLGDPAKGGTMLGEDIIQSIAGNGTAKASLVIDTTGLAGRNVIYVQIDPEMAVNDVDRVNNKALNQLHVRYKMDFAIDYITLTPVQEGIQATVTVRVRTQGKATGTCALRVLAGDVQIGEDLLVEDFGATMTSDMRLSFDTRGISGPTEFTAILDPEGLINEVDEENNILRRTFDIAPAPALAAAGLSFEPDPSHEGNLVRLAATVRNNSPSVASNILIKLQEYMGENWRDLALAIMTLTGDTAETIVYDWDSDGRQGVHCFRLLVDPDYEIYERDKTDNVRELELVVLPADKPDLAVREGDLSHEPAAAPRDGLVRLTARVRNQCSYPAENVAVRFYDGDPAAGGAPIGADQFVALPGRGEVEVSVDWDTTGLSGYYNLHVVVDPDGLVMEAREDNNTTCHLLALRALPEYQPRNLQAAVTGSDVELTWDKVADAGVLGYALYRDGRIINPSLKDRGTPQASSSQPIHKIDNAFDGDPETEWRSLYSMPQWVEVDLGSHRMLEEIAIEWGANPAVDYQLQIWDRDRFLTVADVTGNTAARVEHSLGDGGLLCRRYRILITKKNDSLVSIREIVVSGRDLLARCDFVDTGLASGHYLYTVTSVNQEGEESLPSAPAGADVLRPPTPSGFTAAVDGPNAELSWEQSTAPGFKGYYLLRDGSLINPVETVTGTASASGYAGSSYLPEKANDGLDNTYWRATGNTAWWQLDLGEARYLETLTIKWYESAIAEVFEVLIWSGGQWQKVVHAVGNSDAVSTVALNARYKTDKIRINILKSTGSSLCGIREASLNARQRLNCTSLRDELLTAGIHQYELTTDTSVGYESMPAVIEIVIEPPARPENLQAQVDGRDVSLTWEHNPGTDFAGYLVLRNGIPAPSVASIDVAPEGRLEVSSYYSTYTPDKAVDRNPSTAWYSDGYPPQWFSVSFPTRKVLSGIRVIWGSTYASDYSIQCRQGGAWREVLGIRDNKAKDLTHEFTRPVYTDGLRILCTKMNTNNIVAISEIYIYEYPLVVQPFFFDRDLADGTYAYSIHAADAADNLSPPCGPATVKIGTIAAPVNLRGSANGSQVELAWEMASMEDVAGFQVFRDQVLLNPWADITSSCAATATVNESTVNRIKDNKASTYWTPGLRVYPASVELSLPRPMDLNRLTLQWHQSAASDFKIWAWVDGAWLLWHEQRGNTELTNEIAGGILTTDRLKLELLGGPDQVYLSEIKLHGCDLVKEQTYTDSVLHNRDYFYYVQAISTAGRLSDISNIVTVTVDEHAPPAVPSSLIVHEQDGRLEVRWSPVDAPDLAGYKVYCNTLAVPRKTAGTQQRLEIVHGVAVYVIEVTAYDINENESEPARVEFVFAKPPPPSGLRASRDRNNVHLAWDAGGGMNILGYRVYRDGARVSNRYWTKPTTASASSTHYPGAGGGGFNARNTYDQDTTTCWRPAEDDPAPWLEITYDIPRVLSEVEIIWSAQAEPPGSYEVLALLGDEWTTLFYGNGEARQSVVLPQVRLTNKIMVRILESAANPALAEVAAHFVKPVEGLDYVDSNVAPGLHTYWVTTVNGAELESDPTAPLTIMVPRVDPAVLPGSVNCLPLRPSVLEDITIEFKVANLGVDEAVNIPVALYVGDPADGGIPIERFVIPILGPGENVLIQYVWDPTGFAGERTLYVVADPDDEIEDYDEANNTGTKAVTISECKVLASQLVAVDPGGFPRIRLGVQVFDSLDNGVAGMEKQNFTIYEDGVPQRIESVSSWVEETVPQPKIDLVFVLDASLSTNPERAAMKDIIKRLLDALEKYGLDVDYHIFILDYPPPAGEEKMDQLDTGIFQGQAYDLSIECWGPATAWLAENYAWRPEAHRVVLPVTDENCFGGIPEDQNDLASLVEAMSYCRAHDVTAFPLYGQYTTETGYDYFPDGLIEECRTLGQGTGGEAYYIEEVEDTAASLIGLLMRRKVHYYLEYTATNKIKDGGTRHVEVKVSYRDVNGGCAGQYWAPQDTYGDLAVDSLTATPVTAGGQPVTLRASIKNIGGAAVHDFRIQLHLGDPAAGGVLLHTVAVPELAPNASAVVEASWPARPGEHVFYVTADPDDAVTELREDNNRAAVELIVPGPVRPDLTISTADIVLDKSEPFCGELVAIKATVRNLGADCGPFRAGFYLGDPGAGGELLAARIVTGLSYLGAQELSCTWAAGRTPGARSLFVLIDPLDEIAEADESNNSACREVTVARHPVQGFITTDQPAYGAGEDCALTLTVENHLPADWSGGTARVSVRDAAGKECKYLGSYPLRDIPGKTGETPGLWQQVAVWNVDGLAPGAYSAVFTLMMNDDVFTESATEFTVLPHRDLAGSLVTDKSIYAPRETARITVRAENLSRNTGLNDLSLALTVADASGALVWRAESLIAALPRGGREESVFSWPIADSPGGAYVIAASVTRGPETLWQDDCTVIVDATSILAGNLTVAPAAARAGQTVTYTVQARNLGNEDLAPCELEILLVDAVSREVLQTLSTTCILPAGGEYTAEIADAVALPDARYMAVMQAVIDGKAAPLDGDSLLVDSTPPVTAANLTELRLIKDGVFYGVIGSALTLAATDNLSGVAETLYDLGQGWTRYEGPVPFKAEGVYEARFKSIDRLGNTEDERTIGIVIDQTPPVVRIAAPAEGCEVCPDFGVLIEAGDNLGLERAELYVDGEKRAEFDWSPAEIVLHLEPGPHTLRARALDRAGYESWSIPVGITVIDPDRIPPTTTVTLTGEAWSDGVFKSDVTVTLTAVDNEGGSGVDAVFYRFGGEEAYSFYAGPFTVTREGLHELEFYAVDKRGNAETPRTEDFQIIRPWPAPYGLLCQELRASGDVDVERAFSNGEVTVNGHCRFGYLGTAQSSIVRKGNVSIGQLELNAPYQNLPVPDWAALRQAASLRTERSISAAVELRDVRFERDLKLSGNVRVAGLLVVEGDLTISGNLSLEGVGIFCTGVLTIHGNARISGLVYAGAGLKITGNPEIAGAIAIDGLARFAGNVAEDAGAAEEFLIWLRKKDSD